MHRENVRMILQEIERIHKAMPDQDTCLIIQAAVDKYRGQKNANLCDINEKQFLTALQQYAFVHTEEREKRATKTARHERLQKNHTRNLAFRHGPRVANEKTPLAGVGVTHGS